MIRPNNRWTAEQVDLLRHMIAENFPISFMSKRLGRTEEAVVLKAKRLGVVWS